MATRVLVTDHVFGSLDIERSVLEPLGCELVLAEDASEQTLAAAAAEAKAMLVCYAELTPAVIAAASSAGCKVISRYGGGYDNIDLDAATEHGILVTYVPDYCLDEVADHAMSLLLAMSRGMIDAARAVDRGEWQVPHGSVHRLAGQRLAVIGVGGIGRRVIDRAIPFGFEPVGFDPYVATWDVPAKQADSFEDAVREANAVTVHVPLTPENRQLVNARSIAAMERAPLLVNTARGGLVDLDAAAAALDAGRLGGLALDVTEPEPLPAGHPLRGHPRAVLTPHMAFYSVEAEAELQRRAAEEVARALRAEAPDRPLNVEVLSTS